MNCSKSIGFVLAATMAAFAVCSAQELVESTDVPTFETRVSSVLAVEVDVPSIKTLETKAISILKANYGLTAAEAQAKVRVDGKTDVQRCVDYIVIDRLQGITQGRVTATSMIAEHAQ